VSYYNYSTETVAQKKANALKKLKKLQKKDPTIEPVLIEGRLIAKQWWGKAWNKNLESYADYSNRISRGKSYARQNSLLDLRIDNGVVNAKVSGSKTKIYDVTIHIDALTDLKWSKMLSYCQHKIDSVDALISGSFPVEMEVLFTDKTIGLFPNPKEIEFDCTCPDYAYMCKHVAATLYGVGAKLDQNPLLFFNLRGVDVNVLIKKSIEDKLESMFKQVGKKTTRTISDDRINELFDL
jgi:uncharacterized Zn finger protein